MNTLLTAGFLDASLPQDVTRPHAGPDVLSLLVDVLGHGILVVGEHGQIIHANRAARTELNRHRVLNRVGGEVHGMTPADCKTLQNALGKAVAGKRSLINVSGAGLTLTLAVVPLKPDADAWDARIALLFARAEVCESGMFGFFARSYGLTQTEEQVLAILCRGLSTPEIAVQLKVAVSTVRSHVRSLCAKTGSSGVRELVNRVAVLPPVAPLHLAQIH
ncbi:MAG: helix-turn-helix transcriptional regulator [Polaromonas sp.]|uniref:helix-turn-helix transcriptional regulator n=1 Tax=Polaromonas sp. TaxID=1869339 RepID=UPI002487FF95|nr:helix-turn-helix transcriptional regulator [Polaromonas sp.]MDI1268186.1 helix-turn-helix transcriptional regulator [Polaromonas sp.]MDO9112419.1 helix-turn-helix transcriptional regulator [Polaromonas sp.]MDP1885355.1 helix-turn-helix transcriptional regulator [Polaromonas sp.]